jgi:acyl dehydratase
VNDELPEWTLDHVDPGSMKVLALLLADPNPLHYDVEAARRAGFAERVNQGPSNMAMLLNMLRAAFPDGRVSRLRVQLRGTVLAGQGVRAGGRIVRRERVAGREAVTCEVHLDGPDGARVLTGEATVLQAAGAPSPVDEDARTREVAG